jgi:hypothetical protein
VKVQRLRAKAPWALSATNDTQAFLIAGGGTGGGTAGVGGSLAVLIVWNDTLAYIADSAVVDVTQALAITAESSELNVTAVISGSGGGTAGVAASAAVKTIKSNTQAYIGAGALINSDPAYRAETQSISLTAKNSATTLAGVVGSGSGGGSAGVGASNDTTVLVKTSKSLHCGRSG